MVAGDQQHAAEKNITLVGIGPEFVVEASFRPDGDVALADERLVRAQRHDDFPEVIIDDTDRLFHQRNGQIGVRAVVQTIDEAWLRREIELHARATGESDSEALKFGRARGVHGLC